MKSFLEKIIGSYSDRELKRIYPLADKIEALEPDIQKLTDSQLKAKTAEFKERLANGETLDDILPEAFAVVREASVRVLGMRHFRVQLIGGIVLHQGRISEMKTGEGKTLVATLPVYLNALSGKGVHVVTVNDYLARRDSEQMGKIYTFLGLTVGLIVHDMENEQRREAYGCDITYGTNNELGFDYLRDNMVIYKEDMVQRDLHYAIVDEVDSILIDEARTPLIISGMGDKSTDLYKKANTFALKLKAKIIKQMDDKVDSDTVYDEDYIVDEKAHTAVLTANGIKKAEQYFGLENLSDPENMTVSHHVNQAIRAHGLMKNEKDYVVKDGEVIIVDEFTGRMMYGRRYSDGLHQAIEAKEGVKVERESKTLATITFQNYFRMYSKLAGMTGTALTEENEFNTIYKLDVIVIPTNKEMIRKDNPDVVYKNEVGKFNAVIEDIAEGHKRGQPALIGTISIEKSEFLSAMLKRRGIPHQVLNAKYHDKEAEIIAQAGKLGAVTIATNMAGRGTDIVLGGNSEFMSKQEMRKLGYSEELISASTSFNDTDDQLILEARSRFKELNDKYKQITNTEREKVVEAGGLHIIGTERHESRRIDNQLRGRSGRQGDPGSSRFYISLEDDLMRLFGSERLTSIVNALGLEDDQPIEHKMLSNAIENAQKKVEGRNFDVRKRVLQYDDVMNKQREVIYAQRRTVLNGDNLRDYFIKMFESLIDNVIETYCAENQYADMWDWDTMTNYLESVFLPQGALAVSDEERSNFDKEDLKEKLMEIVNKIYEYKENDIGIELMRELERVVLLRVVDEKWMDHIDAMDQLKHGIGLRAYGQRDPVIEYKFEGFQMFEEMIKTIQEDSIRLLVRSRIDREHAPQREKVAEPVNASHGDDEPKKPVTNNSRVGRNDPCPCGSGKKYKVCCGK
ncbi:protein translocase subunit SecA [Ruminiclostridium hungatei]|uniref:Protein translocase subunit SecA n=1 Tax=Ruminiclostridium hungatei TaxID=48256 RepID=A0A1V4SJR8_RUMHU|nr:preprotein translocase subunit SecA [Ruminiclostridium hungatei]OPX44142.1 protein translocase subunit SecA [Ruminiclostridium hungatei]